MPTFIPEPLAEPNEEIDDLMGRLALRSRSDRQDGPLPQDPGRSPADQGTKKRRLAGWIVKLPTRRRD